MELAHIRPPSVRPTERLTEDLTVDELAEDLKVYELIEDLKAEDVAVRLDAVLALGKMKGDRAVMALIPLLRNSPLEIVRFVAATALGEIGDRRAVMPLIDALEDKDTTSVVEVAAATALAKINDPKAVEPLLENLGHENPDVRVATADALGSIKDLRAVMPLIAALGDENHLVRISAARALGKMKDPLAVDPLITSFREDRVSDVRWWAAHALGDIRDPRAIEPLAGIVVIRDPRGMGKLIDVIEVKDPRFVAHPLSYLVTGVQWSIQAEAIRSLGKIGEEALPHLISTLLNHHDLDFRKEAAQNIIGIKCAQFMISLLEEGKSLEIVKEVYPDVISTGESGTEDVLIETLNAYGELNMARDFLESRNEKLKRAALVWMERNGHKPVPAGTGKRPHWGEDSKEDCEASPTMDEENL